jgi:hypothetical protein
MKTNYKFQGNKIIKTMELNEDEIEILQKINKGEITLVCHIPLLEGEKQINYIISSLDFIKYSNNNNVYYLNNIGKQFLKQLNSNKEPTNQNILQIPIKFQLGQTVYTIRKIKSENPFLMCNGKGTGKNISNKLINVVCDDEFTIKTINPNIDKDGATVKYKIQSGTLTLKRAEENLFLSKEEAQKKCDELNDPRIDVKVSDIKVSSDFKNSKPSIGKILKKLDYYNRYGKFNTDIILDKDNILIDGYINYLICQLLHIETVKVIIKEKLLNKKEN